MSQNYDCTRNRFNPDNRFIGDIENGLRYPFACYTKDESDARYLLKSEASDLEADVDALKSNMQALAEVVGTKADKTTVEAMQAQIVDILARLDNIEYKQIAIQTFTANTYMIELGSNSTIDLVWSLNKVADTQTINGATVTGTTKQYANVSASTTYNLVVSDSASQASKSISVEAANQIYYGVAADLSNVTSLSKVLSNNPARIFTVNAGAGQYIIYAIPARLGNVEFWVENFEGGFEDPVIQNITNASGYTEAYKVYRSTNANLGATTVEVKEE